MMISLGSARRLYAGPLKDLSGCFVLFSMTRCFASSGFGSEWGICACLSEDFLGSLLLRLMVCLVLCLSGWVSTGDLLSGQVSGLHGSLCLAC